MMIHVDSGKLHIYNVIPKVTTKKAICYLVIVLNKTQTNKQINKQRLEVHPKYEAQQIRV